MVDDIVPGLLEAIEKDFMKNMDNPAMKRVLNAVTAGTATYKDANDFATWTGQFMSMAIKKNVTADILPDGRMYYNIAERILGSTLGRNHEMISSVAEQVQTSMNKSAGIGIKAVKPPLNQDRLDGLIERISGEEDFEKVKWLLDEPIVNFSQAIIDASIRLNADLHAKAGLSPVLHRIASPSCCEWCDNLAGTYDYDDAPDDIYRRHERCRCTVDYDPGEGKRQNVWTKGWS